MSLRRSCCSHIFQRERSWTCYEGRCYVSLVGFLFQNTRLKSVPIPFHRTFEEVNLRFYVQHTKSTGERRRGVVFISELVPRFALSLVANTIYGENYATVPMRHQWEETDEQRSVRYQWRHKGRWNELHVSAAVRSAADRSRIAPRSSSRSTIGVTPSEVPGPPNMRFCIRAG